MRLVDRAALGGMRAAATRRRRSRSPSPAAAGASRRPRASRRPTSRARSRTRRSTAGARARTASARSSTSASRSTSRTRQARRASRPADDARRCRARARRDARTPSSRCARGDACKTMTPAGAAERERRCTRRPTPTARSFVVLLGDAERRQGLRRDLGRREGEEDGDVSLRARRLQVRRRRDARRLDLRRARAVHVAGGARARCTRSRARKIANVGGKDFGVVRQRARAGRRQTVGVPRGERRTGSRSRTSSKGKVEKTIDISALFGDAQGRDGQPRRVRAGAARPTASSP